MESIGQMLVTCHRDLLSGWVDDARLAASARGLSTPELLQAIPDLLSALALPPGDARDQRVLRVLGEQVGARVRQGFELGEIVEELAILERSIGHCWASRPDALRPAPAELDQVLSDIQRCIRWTTNAFEAHMREDEQADKQWARRLEADAHRALVERMSPRELSRQLLEVVLESMRCQIATLLLFDAGTARLVEVATAGTPDTAFGQYVTALGSRSVAAEIASADSGPTEFPGVTTTSLDVGPSLRATGVHSVLGVRLPPRSTLVGVLFIGLLEKRAFTDREVRRLEMLAERVLVHVESVRLHAELRATVEALEGERALREKFVALLAHDLRTPLSTAGLAAQLLRQRCASGDDRAALADRIVRNVARADRMLRDLLDVSRTRAGSALPIEPAELDLAEVARSAIAELPRAQAERVVITTEPMRGWWDGRELERALGNLMSNALKYGAPDTPITVRAERSGAYARISVNNRGNPLSPEQRARIFEPFAQETAGRGWGLGLALVRACAEAHGGTASVESDPEHGTTFTIELPIDARRSVAGEHDRVTPPPR